jgi:hypothetical protein
MSLDREGQIQCRTSVEDSRDCGRDSGAHRVRVACEVREQHLLDVPQDLRRYVSVVTTQKRESTDNKIDAVIM